MNIKLINNQQGNLSKGKKIDNNRKSILNLYLKYVLKKIFTYFLIFFVFLNIIFLISHVIFRDFLFSFINKYVSGEILPYMMPRPNLHSYIDYLGVEKSFFEEYITFLINLFRFDFGPYNYEYRNSPNKILIPCMQYTLILFIPSYVMSIIIGNYIARIIIKMRKEKKIQFFVIFCISLNQFLFYGFSLSFFSIP